MASQVPALLIRLNIDADTAHARKPDHKLAMLRDKVRVIPTLNFNGANILDLDGRDPYPQVLQAALTAARAVIAHPNSPDRKSVGEGKRVSVRVDLGGRRSLKKTKI